MMKTMMDFCRKVPNPLNFRIERGYLIGLLMLLFSFYVVYAPGHEGMLPQPSQISYPTDRAAARAALERKLHSYGLTAEGIYDVTCPNGMLGKGALWSRIYTGNSDADWIFVQTNPSPIFDKDGKMLQNCDLISNPFTFHLPTDVQALAEKLQNGGALPNAYLVLFKLSCVNINDARPQDNISLLYFDQEGFFFSINRSRKIPKNSVLYKYWAMDPEFHKRVTLRSTIASKIPATLPPASRKIPDEVMRELLARQAILAYHKSDTAALNLLGKLAPQGKSIDGQIVKYGNSANEILAGIQSKTEKAAATQSSVPYAVITVDGQTLYLHLLPKGQDDWYLYLTPTKPSDGKFAWEAISVGQIPGWTPDTDTGRDSDQGHKFAVWCANGMSDSEWKLDPAEHLKFLREFLFRGRYFSGIPTADFIKGISYIQEHIDGHDPDATAEFTKYAKEVSKHLTPTRDAPVITQEAIDLWTAIVTARPAEYQAKDPDFREKFAATAWSTLYLGLTIPTFPREAFDYFHVGAQLINSLKNANANSESDETETDYYGKLQDATVRCVVAAQRWIRRDLLVPAELPLAIEDLSLEAKLEASERKQAEQVEASERRHAEMMQEMREQMRIQQAAFMEALEKQNRSRSGSSGSGISGISRRSNRSHRSLGFTPSVRARNAPSSPLVAQNLEAMFGGSTTVRAASEPAASEHGTPSENPSEALSNASSPWVEVPTQSSQE